MEVNEAVKRCVAKHYQTDHPSKKQWEADVQQAIVESTAPDGRIYTCNCEVYRRQIMERDAKITRLQKQLDYASQWAAERLNHGFTSCPDKNMAMTPEYVLHYWEQMLLDEEDMIS